MWLSHRVEPKLERQEGGKHQAFGEFGPQLLETVYGVQSYCFGGRYKTFDSFHVGSKLRDPTPVDVNFDTIDRLTPEH